jgi:alpha-tubulin suppressor-like RCC1 family protein
MPERDVEITGGEEGQMRGRTVGVGILGLALGTTVLSCGAGDAGDNSVGWVSLALVGQGNLGNSYRLMGATFAIVGATSVNIHSDDEGPNSSVITRTLSVGAYQVTLLNGWTMQRIAADGTLSAVTATLASTNSHSFIIRGNETTSISWVFNVSPSGTGRCLEDCEIVPVADGQLSMTLSTREIGWESGWSGSDHTCGMLASGQIKCWGDNRFCQLGYGDTTARFAPPAGTVNLGTGRSALRVVTSSGVSIWATYGAFTCALLDDRTVKCWGYNGHRQLGYNDNESSCSPRDAVVDLGGQAAKTIVLGADFACAIYGDANAVVCWGDNEYLQLGTSTAWADVALSPGEAAIGLVAGISHVCAILASRQVKCWGNNLYGQLGYGGYTYSSGPPAVPVDLGAGRTAKRLTAGYMHTCAILDDDSVKCWGGNDYGQLGYNDTTSSPAPRTDAVSFGAGRYALRISAGYYHTCALLDDYSLRCWGYNSYGQLGYGLGPYRWQPSTEPINLGTGRAARCIMASGHHTCALLTDNSLTCWGYNSSGNFGTGGAEEVIGDDLSEMGDGLAETLP